jgi:dienelactone hydrolase
MIRSNVFFFLLLFILLTGCQTRVQENGLLLYRNSKGVYKPVKSQAEMEIKREQILDSMQAVMGQLPDRSNLPPFDLRIIDSSVQKSYIRYRINFAVAIDERIPANLYVPHQRGTKKKLPAMLAVYYTDPNGKTGPDGRGQDTYWAYGRELAERGYVVIAPDYPGYGDLKDYDFANDRYESGTMKSIFDNMRCVDLLQSRDDVNPEQIGVIGLSLAGHTSMFTGAFDKRLKVVVSSSGWTLLEYYPSDDSTRLKGLIKTYGNRLGPWSQDVYMPLFRDKYKFDIEKIPFDFDEVIAAIAPRAFFSVSPLKDSNFDVQGVKVAIESVSEVYRLLGAEEKLQVRYPDVGHDFPEENRKEAYIFIDNLFGHNPDFFLNLNAGK